jgi:Mn-dependent DtxR family transcriptional regulator
VGALRTMSADSHSVARCLDLLAERGWVQRAAGGDWTVTETGGAEARRLVTERGGAA